MSSAAASNKGLVENRMILVAREETNTLSQFNLMCYSLRDAILKSYRSMKLPFEFSAPLWVQGRKDNF
jgi:hypothetical protein